MWLINEEMERQRGRVSRREYGMEDLRYDIELVAFFFVDTGHFYFVDA